MAKTKGKGGGVQLGESATHLLHRALQRALDFHAEASGDSGLTQRQFAVLTVAAAADGLSQSDLVRATGIDRSTLADLVARMIAKGLLLRERSAKDARANTVRLSDAGRTALREGAKPASAADARLLDMLPAKKREAFMKALATLADASPKAEKPAKPAKTEKKKKKKKTAA